MRKHFNTLTTIFLLLLFISTVNGQTENIEVKDKSNPLVRGTLNNEMEFSGIVLNSENKTPLLYTTIYILNTNRGTISNELGHFTINISGLNKTDTLRFQYVGYKTRTISLGELVADSLVYLKEESFNLSEILVFATEPDAVAIVKNVVKNKKSNYRKTTSKKQTFIRLRDNLIMDDFSFDYKKSSLAELDRETFDRAGEKISKNTTSYTDFLVNLYFNKDEANDIKFDPIKMVSLKEADISKPSQVSLVLKKALADTREGEYWKVKSGIFSKKIDKDEMGSGKRTDSLGENTQRLSFYTSSVKEQLEYSQMEDKDQWEFLYSTSKYNYTIGGGTRVNGEDVYIIDFTPKKKGLYMGRIFISVNTYALIKADYKYAPDKIGKNVNFLGIGYTEKSFKGSIYFEKKEDNYVLKYFSRKIGTYMTLDRNLALQKKKSRTFFDKKLEEIKIGLIIKLDVEESLEVLVFDDMKISNQQYTDFNQPEYIKPIFVKQFNDNLWKDYDIIEPTEQMKDYKKHEDN
ncbi:MAG: carboxypeptidase-like regulatory domain-containing protein [Bacteroidota bacterium]